MPKLPLNPLFYQSPPKLPLRVVVIVPFVLQIIATVGLVGYLSFTNGKRAINDLANQLQNEITARIQQKLNIFLETPHLVNQLNVNAIRLNQLNIQEINDVERHLWQQIQSFDSIGVIGITSTSGTMIAVSRQDNNRFNIIITDESTKGELQEYATNAQGVRTNLTKVVPEYDPHIRPWYQDGIATGKAGWGEMFRSLIDQRVEIMATQPVIDNDDNAIALVTATLTFSELHDFLKRLKISKSGEAFILNRYGQLIASSATSEPFIQDNGDLKLIDASNSNDLLVNSASKHLKDRFEDLNQIQSNLLLNFDIDGQQQFLQVVPFNDQYGLDWLILVVIPEADFTERIHGNTRITIALCFIALIIAIIFGLFSCELIIKPVKNLKQAATSISIGKWEQRVKEVPIEELAILAQGFNQMTEQLKKSFVELENKNTALQEADQFKDEFMKNISHELRTPLNSIICSIKLILDGFCDSQEEETELLHQADKSAIHLLNLINELLDLVQIKEGKLPVNKNLVNLYDCLNEIIDSQQSIIQQKNLQLYKSNLSKSIFVEADPKKLKQVFLNILDNAIKFTETGSITIDVQIKPSINTYDIDQVPIVVVTIKDTGIGVEPSEQYKLFQSFAMVDGSTTRAYSGCGLGLSISRSLMELMGGNITLESAGKNQGTAVSISLPITLKTTE
ncbi:MULTISPECIES: sensor histidine kinase [Okeania]|uniref:histidine kinase n=3 Tax=Okeania TaxID=1458928 RepID=A0A3N6NPM7_9CYAN|nr:MULTISPECIES: sensor histidine kinase [Okeania]NET75615.1 HAMP domain-containing protein [Okeania sp. SIO1F9]RQH13831.1 sensor histidine kinase [Okeania hirsuta]RQH43187.1 sensor histidine kinase [Okeania hirsuta]